MADNLDFLPPKERNKVICLKESILPLSKKVVFAPQGWKQASVLIPFYWNSQEWEIFYTHRSSQLMSHSGQVSFPGGSVDASDKTYCETAVRESYEEIHLLKENVSVLGELPKYYTVSRFVITPVVGVIRFPEQLIPNPNEVESIFSVPLAFLRNKDHWVIKKRSFSDVEFESAVYYAEYEGEVVWGITAAITQVLISSLSQ